MPTDRPGPLRLVDKPPLDGAAAVKRRIRKAPRPAAMIQCHRCGSREVIETRTGVMLKDGKPAGGTKALICAGCWLTGERIVLL